MDGQLSIFETLPTGKAGTRKETTPNVINVASVPQRSPFRYPGGKTWLIPVVRKWLKQSIPNAFETKTLIEPFAGGGIVSLTAAFESLADQIVMVELDQEVAAVWEVIINGDHH
ncbi:MAG: DNA adenine methylase, partial [Saprospiraceae bacterium]|nr:DNA adenine methylase [Saprospiraceae bacterium]